MLKNQRGFTFIEVILTVIIMGLLSTMAMPALNEVVNNHKLKSAARTLASDLRLAQETAISEEATVMISFYKSGTLSGKPLKGHYIIKTIESSGKVTNTLKILPQEVALDSATFGSNSELTFTKLGSPTQGGTVTLSLAANSSKKSYVVVAVGSGRIRISPHHPSAQEVGST